MGREPGLTDLKLLRQVARGNRDAFVDLYDRYRPRLLGYLVRLIRDVHRAEDLTDDVMFEVWRRAAKFEGRSAPSTWIFGIAHNMAVSELRKRREAQLDEEAAERIIDPSPNAMETLDRQDRARVIRAGLERLSADHREVIELTYFQELSIREIAEVVGCPENTVKTRMFHARKRLAAFLTELDPRESAQ